MQKYEFVAQKSEKLLKFLSKNLKSFSYANFCIALKNKDILVNSVRVKQDVLLNPNDKICIFLSDAKFKFKIVYQDENIVVFNKPKGVEVCDGDYNLQKEYQIFFGEQIFAIHRIDAGTSGLVLFAKNKKVEKFLIENFKQHNVTKYYYAVVFGSPKQNQTLQSFLVKDKQSGIVKIYDQSMPKSCKIETVYTLKKQQNELCLLDVKIVAGKTHQIRAHLAHFGLPIVGDDKYGNKQINKKFKKTKQMLQSYKIVFNFDKQSEYSYLNNLNLTLDCEFKNF